MLVYTNWCRMRTLGIIIITLLLHKARDLSIGCFTTMCKYVCVFASSAGHAYTFVIIQLERKYECVPIIRTTSSQHLRHRQSFDDNLHTYTKHYLPESARSCRCAASDRRRVAPPVRSRSSERLAPGWV